MLSDILVNIVWFKRDLRIQDHAPLYQATQKSLFDKNNMVIPIFSWDASVWSSQDYSQQRDIVVTPHSENLPFPPVSQIILSL
ncbi:MAG: deoxyribodipyrimidine photo-lyase [Methylophilaceae bacterium]